MQCALWLGVRTVVARGVNVNVNVNIVCRAGGLRGPAETRSVLAYKRITHVSNMLQ